MYVRVEADRIVWCPVLPNSQILAQCAISRARYVSEDAVELDVALDDLTIFTRPWNLDIRHATGIHISHDQVRRRQTLCLVDKHVGTLGVRVVCHNKATGHRVERIRFGGERRVDSLNQLRSLGPRGRTHVEHEVLWPDVEEERREH